VPHPIRRQDKEQLQLIQLLLEPRQINFGKIVYFPVSLFC